MLHLLTEVLGELSPTKIQILQKKELFSKQSNTFSSNALILNSQEHEIKAVPSQITEVENDILLRQVDRW